MADLWEVIADWEYPFGAIRFAIPIGTRLVSRDGGETYRFEGREALTVLTHGEVLRLKESGLVREAD
jgi:hypothetical protein